LRFAIPHSHSYNTDSYRDEIGLNPHQGLYFGSYPDSGAGQVQYLRYPSSTSSHRKPILRCLSVYSSTQNQHIMAGLKSYELTKLLIELIEKKRRAVQRIWLKSFRSINELSFGSLTIFVFPSQLR
jgi:hypothetical protein